MLGFRKDGTVYPDSLAGSSYNQKFVFYGDPNDNAGNSIENPIEGDFVDPGDRRFVMNTGPFTLAPSDSQEIIISVINSFGSTTRLGAVNDLLNKEESVRENYNSIFNEFNVSQDPSITNFSAFW